ncbi:hypothetical protein J3E69DRAFT_231841 [Trichoderma sp. SZMC 28015]
MAGHWPLDPGGLGRNPRYSAHKQGVGLLESLRAVSHASKGIFSTLASLFFCSLRDAYCTKEHAAYKYVPRWQHSAALPREDRGLHAEREGKGGTSVSIRMELVGRALVPGELLLEVRK